MPASTILRDSVLPAILLAVLGAILLVIELTGVEPAEWMLMPYPVALATVLNDVVHDDAPRWANVAAVFMVITLGIGAMFALDGLLPEMWAFYAAAWTATIAGYCMVWCLHRLVLRHGHTE